MGGGGQNGKEGRTEINMRERQKGKEGRKEIKEKGGEIERNK